MVQKGWHVILACRNLEKGRQAMEHVNKKCSSASLELLQLDLSSYDSIRQFADSLRGRKIDALFNNAGIMCRRFSLTDEGIERTFAVNYLGTARLTKHIIPLMPDGGNIVNMVSLTARLGRLNLDWPAYDERHFGQLSTYASSKRALLYYSIALANRHPELHVNVSDPGVVNSNMITMNRWYDSLADLFFRPFIKTPQQGAAPAIGALHATDSLRYFVGKKHKRIASKYVNSPMVDQLWSQLQSFF